MTEDFNDFDAQAFDPNNFVNEFGPTGSNSKGQPIGGGVTMITLKAVNASTTLAQTAQFFGIGTGIAAMVSDSAITAFTPLAGPPLAATANAANASRFYWTTSGTLVYQNAANELMTLSCNEINYRSLCLGTFFGKFKITRVRFTPTTDAQIDNVINFNERTMFGKTWNDSINPRQYFRPDQFQAKIIDIPYNWVINQERNFSQIVNIGEICTYALNIVDVMKAQK